MSDKDYFPDSEQVPSSLAEISPILRVANELYRTQSSRRIGYLCFLGAFEKAVRLDPRARGRGVHQFRTSFLVWLQRNDDEKKKGIHQTTDVPKMLTSYMDYYMKHIQPSTMSRNIKQYIEVKKKKTTGTSASSADPGAAREATTVTDDKTANVIVDSSQLTNACQTAVVLYQVLELLWKEEELRKEEKLYRKVMEAHHVVEILAQIFVPYNILPLYPHLNTQIKVVVSTALKSKYEPEPAPYEPLSETDFEPDSEPEPEPEPEPADILDWLGPRFGFQIHNILNQKENLMLLLANVQSRRFRNEEPPNNDGVVNTVMNNILENYKRWLRFLNLGENQWLQGIEQKGQQHKMLYIGLYLLIWGEAANVRFMPECLCYIYHHMAEDLYEMLYEGRGESRYGGGHEAFLKKVVTPIYKTIAAEKERGARGKHSDWRNYDDLNEFFWSGECLDLGWPMQPNHDFFAEEDGHDENPQVGHPASADVSALVDVTATDAGSVSPPDPGPDTSNPVPVPPIDGPAPDAGPVAPDKKKVNFIEKRSFLHLFRSFDRMWTFYILSLQAMIIIAKNGSGELRAIFQSEVFYNVLSIFITAAVLQLVQALLDIYLSWNAIHSIPDAKLRYIWKAVEAFIWILLFSITYTHSSTSFSTLVILKVIQGFLSICLSLDTIPRIVQHRNFWRAVLVAIWAVVLKITYSSDLSDFYSTQAICIYVILPMSTLVLFVFSCFGVRNISVEGMMWWYQPRLYVGRDMHENAWSFIKYTMFWIILLIFKFTVSYFAQIKPLIGPTKDIMRVHISVNHWSSDMNTWALVFMLWSPVILVYFMDTQIWYAVLSSLLGYFIGAYKHLGEVQTLGSLKTIFHVLSRDFNKCSVIIDNGNPEGEKNPFYQMWNTIISSLRQENLINNLEEELLRVPYWKRLEVVAAAVAVDEEAVEHEVLQGNPPIRWPLFLLANKIPIAVEMAKRCNDEGHEVELRNKLNDDVYMISAVKECYASFKILLKTLLVNEGDRLFLQELFDSIDVHVQGGTLTTIANLSYLPKLYEKFSLLLKRLRNNEIGLLDLATIVIQMLDVVRLDMMRVEFERVRVQRLNHMLQGENINHEFFRDFRQLPLPPIEGWIENMKRLHHLVTFEDVTMDVPSNLEARRRLTFFTNSLLMDMPRAPKISNMCSFSALTPFYEEDVLFSNLDMRNEDGISILFYLQKIFPDEWKNFLEQVDCPVAEFEDRRGALEEEIRLWASYRGQTLTRTVRGMMYYREALEIQAFFELASDAELREGYEAYHKSPQDEIWATCQTLADMKFTYVVSCQLYGHHRRSGNPRARDILRLMTRYPSLRVAYIDEVEQILPTGTRIIYYSTLVKATPGINEAQDQVIYRIKLPGKPIMGEGKPENQNHAIIFTRGEALQTIDMNQDNYLEEAFKMRNLLQEFCNEGIRRPRILGLREHIFTGSVSSLARFMSNQETSFVTLGQRVLASALKVRFHYGHPDVFDRVFHLTRGGVSKASKTINLSEDIFGGFNSILRGGNITHHEYIQVGKGRDVGLNQISMFEAKIANGSGEQTLSRDLYRLGHQFDFFRMLSCYFTTTGFYFCSMLTVLTIYVFLYGRLYLALSGLQQEMWIHPVHDIKALQAVIGSQSVVQMGFLLVLPMIVVIILESGYLNAGFEFVMMHFQLASVFFTFQLGTKAHYYGRTLLHGGAKYIATGRGFVVLHDKFAENYRLYSRSHFVKAFELMILLLVYHMFRHACMGTLAYFLITCFIWFMVGSWVFAPFLFNPSSFEWHRIFDDWRGWMKWINVYDHEEIRVDSENSWESWWEKETEHLRHSGKLGISVEIGLALRFFIFQSGLAYQLKPFENYHSLWVFLASWLLFLIIMAAVRNLSQYLGMENLGTATHIWVRSIKFVMVLALLVSFIYIIALRLVTFKDIFICIFAFILSGWGILLIAQACKHWITIPWIKSSVRTLAWGYDFAMGSLLLVVVTLLAWFPFVSELQTRILFNQAFSRGLQISRNIGGDQNNA